MKCFRHPEIDSLGICKACCKGLCGLCLVDVGNGLACKNSCEHTVNALNARISETKGFAASNTIALFFTGCLAIAAGLNMMHLAPIVGFALVGLGFILFGISGWYLLRIVLARRELSQNKGLALTSSLNPEHHESDSHLENEFRKLESDSKETKLPD